MSPRDAGDHAGRVTPALRDACRILVAGASGSGKTTLAARIGAALGLPHVEIDRLHWHAGWTPNPGFEQEVAALAAQERWITEWQYSSARPLLAARADLLIWLDLPRRTVLSRVVTRTLRRRLLRVELWHGDQEPPLRSFFSDPDHIVRWSMSTWSLYPDRVREALRARPDLRLVRLRSDRDVRRLLRLLGAEHTFAR